MYAASARTGDLRLAAAFHAGGSCGCLPRLCARVYREIRVTAHVQIRVTALSDAIQSKLHDAFARVIIPAARCVDLLWPLLR